MELKDMIDSYEEYARKHRLVPVKHRTYLAYMIMQMSEMLSWLSESGDIPTDKYLESVANLSSFYKIMEEPIEHHADSSEPFLVKGKIPKLFIDKLADLTIQIMMYAGATGVKDEFLDKLNKKFLEDSASNSIQSSRFNNKRLDW